jgi:glycosyltransferase involved in cell wall biosynthesis
LVSIITVSYNSEKTIEKTIESVLNQSYDDIEYIIIDGDSFDHTVDIIKSYEDKFIKRGYDYKWISENDDGIASAWNKGLKIANGDIISLLNSDDWYEEHAVRKAVDCLNVNKAEISYGICKKISDGQVYNTIDRKLKKWKIYLNLNFSHTTCFKTRKTYDCVGLFDDNYDIALDIDFLLRAYNKKVNFKKCNNITFMKKGGISEKYEVEARKEYLQALIENGFNPFLSYLGYLIKFILSFKRS